MQLIEVTWYGGDNSGAATRIFTVGWSYHCSMDEAKAYISKHETSMPPGADYPAAGTGIPMECEPVFAMLVQHKGTLYLNKRHKYEDWAYLDA